MAREVFPIQASNAGIKFFTEFGVKREDELIASAGQEINSNPNVLAKWELDYGDITTDMELNLRLPSMACLMKRTAGASSLRLAYDRSDDNETWASMSSVLTSNETYTALELFGSNTAIPSSTRYIRIAFYNNDSTTAGAVKNLIVSGLMVIPAGMKVKRLV